VVPEHSNFVPSVEFSKSENFEESHDFHFPSIEKPKSHTFQNSALRASISFNDSASLVVSNVFRSQHFHESHLGESRHFPFSQTFTNPFDSDQTSDSSDSLDLPSSLISSSDSSASLSFSNHSEITTFRTSNSIPPRPIVPTIQKINSDDFSLTNTLLQTDPWVSSPPDDRSVSTTLTVGGWVAIGIAALALCALSFLILWFARRRAPALDLEERQDAASVLDDEMEGCIDQLDGLWNVTSSGHTQEQTDDSGAIAPVWADSHSGPEEVDF
jgi:hypothetical protein